jgi:hypothetical protein
MKKKVLLFLVLATLVAGGAFAQKTGDTGDFMGKNYTVKEIRNGEVILILTPTLDGTWKATNGTVITFNGNSAVYKQISPNAIYQSAVNKGFIKVGGQWARNFKKTGDLTYTGQIVFFSWDRNAPDVCTGVQWGNITFTLSADGKTFTDSLGGVATRQ